MPRHPDPDLEDRLLHAAEVLWRRGGTKALTMRAVAKAAGSNTPAVYRRFKDRQDLVRGILLRVAERLRKYFAQGRTASDMAEAYLQFALENPHEYELFFSEARMLNVPRKRGMPPKPIRESRPNFAFVEKVLANELGGAPEDYTRLALQLWAISHGTAVMLIQNTVPDGHEGELQEAFRTAVRALIEAARPERTK